MPVRRESSLTAGIIEIGGRAISLRSPIHAIDHGIGYVPQERRTEGVILYLGVAPNITLSSLEEIMQAGVSELRPGSEGRQQVDQAAEHQNTQPTGALPEP